MCQGYCFSFRLGNYSKHVKGCTVSVRSYITDLTAPPYLSTVAPDGSKDAVLTATTAKPLGQVVLGVGDGLAS